MFGVWISKGNISSVAESMRAQMSSSDFFLILFYLYSLEKNLASFVSYKGDFLYWKMTPHPIYLPELWVNSCFQITDYF
jgi:hypothetical protein